jgi:hypothetical protein
MNQKFVFAPPVEIERMRAKAYLELTPTQKYYYLMNLIKVKYVLKQGNEKINASF